MEHLDNIIINYLNAKSKNNYALMISGKWGSGKTHYFKNFIKDNKNKEGGNPKKVIYVSLNGISSLEEIFQNIIGEKLKIIHFFSSSLAGKFTFGLIKAVATLGNNIIEKNTGWNIFSNLKYPKKESEKIKNEIFDFSNNLICFDDLERISKNLDIADVLGFINSTFVEHEGVKVIIICNEKEIISKGGSQDENNLTDEDKKYYTIKEKLIGRTIIFNPEIKILIQKLIDLYSNDSDYFKFLIDNSLFIKEKILNSGEDNLRTILFMLESLKTVFINTPSDLFEKFKKEILLFLIAVSFEYKKGNFKKHSYLNQVLEALGSYYESTFTSGDLEFNFEELDHQKSSSEMEEDRKIRAEIDAMKRTIKEKYIKDENFIFLPPIFEFIESGYFDQNSLYKFLQNLLPKEETPQNIVLKNIKQSYNLPDRVFLESIPILLENIRNGEYNLPEFIEAAKALHDLSKNEIIKEYPKDNLNKFLLEYIHKTSLKTTYNDLQEIRRVMITRTPQFQESDKLLKAIEALQESIKTDAKKTQIDENLQKIRNNNYINIDQEDFRDIIIHHSTEAIINVIQAKYSTSPQNLILIADLLQNTYPVQNNIPLIVTPSEAEKLNQIHNWVQSFILEIPVETMPISHYWVKHLQLVLENILDNLKPNETRMSHLK